MKQMIIYIALFSVTAISLNGQTGKTDVVSSILASYSAREYSTEPVTDEEIEKIVACGIKAPSGRNSQPWKFTVVKDTALSGKILPGMAEGNVLIIVSGLDAKQGNTGVYFNCALATQNMYLAAQGLGLGARIYGGAVWRIDSILKDGLEIPETYGVVTILRIGNLVPGVDAVSSASPRNPKEDIVNYK